MATICDDGRVRTGTVWTATAYAVTAVIGSGVLAVPWSVAQIGWLFGLISLAVFAAITYISARLLSDCYRSPDPNKGQRNYNYLGAVKAILGKKDVIICAVAQCSLLWGAMVGYTITAATSMLSIKRTNCYHANGPNADCQPSGNSFMLIFGAIQIILSQFPNLGNIAFLSVIAATMSFEYSFIALYLCIMEFASHPQLKGTLTGVPISEEDGVSTLSTKIWHCFQALGNIAFSYTYCELLVEIQDTLKSPPSECKTMKRATLYSIGLTTAFYISLGCMGYLAFGNKIAGNVLTAFHEPFWLVDLAHVGLIIHMTGAFQVLAQPIYALYENWLASKYPNSSFIYKSYNIQLPCTFGRLRPNTSIQFTLCRLLLRPLLVAFTILIAMMFPFFNAVLGLLGSIAFWPLTVYLPITMYMAQANTKGGRSKWLVLQCLSILSLTVSIVAGVGSVADIVQRFKKAKLFSAPL